MIVHIDRLQVELPPPSDPDPAGAAAVQELLGGRFGEKSTFLSSSSSAKRGTKARSR
jgi:Mn-containing catalase